MEAANNARVILNVVSAAMKARGRDSEQTEGVANDSSQRHVPVYVGSDFSYGGLPVASAGMLVLLIAPAFTSNLQFLFNYQSANKINPTNCE